jgi:electron transport complex protein RnfB
VDAILGGPKQMHTVIAAECTGCDLCLPPCPVECIEMVAVEQGLGDWQWPYPAPEGRLPEPRNHERAA